ncbi:MAG: ornithine cyclodeaminase [Chloroflexota bacterium]|nr:ornithine cyclodeaminase [Chloroflexota bacterium]
MRALTRAELRRLVPMTDAIELMKVAFAELSAGRAASPLRTVLPLHDGAADALYMPAYVPALGALGVKVVSVFSGNPSRGLPLIHALVCLTDPETGEPLAILDGTYLTALRTGAASGAATDLLARPGSRVLVTFGAGAQGVTQVAAVCSVRPIERVVVVDPNRDARERFRTAIEADWQDLLGRVEFSDDPRVVGEADVVCAATTSRQPVFDDADVRPGTHINAVGAYTPEMQEIPPETVRRATVVVDAVDAALAEAGDLIKPLQAGIIGREHLERELGMVAAGLAPGRRSEEEITFFKSVGNAVQDVVVARRAVDRASDEGVGMTIELG